MLRASTVVGDDIIASAENLAGELREKGAAAILADARATTVASNEAR
jgi:hypothetical protein